MGTTSGPPVWADLRGDRVAPAISTHGLTKRYGDTVGIQELDLTVAEGEVFGFLGPNGAGKTTTIRLLLDLIRPTAGSAQVLGYDCQEEAWEVRARVGYLPGELSLWPKDTGREVLDHLATLRGIDLDEGLVTHLARRFDAQLERPIGELSRGNKQKIGILQALVGEPELLVLDEPTTGLDPINQRIVLELVDDARSQGRTVFLSSHILPEVQRVCDRVGIVRGGQLVAVEDVDALVRRGARRLEIQFAHPAPATALADVDGVRELETDGPHATLTFEGSLDPLIKELAEHTVTDLRRHEGDLSQVFLAYYDDQTPSEGAQGAHGGQGAQT